MNGSPDIADYVTLDLIDRDPQDVFDIAKQYLQTVFPDLVLREGMMETVLLEAVALEVAESIFAINRLPDSITEILLQFFDIQRDVGEPPVADISFSISGPQGATIPVGFSLVYDPGTGVDPLVMQTDAELTIPEGSATGVVSATAINYTDMFNGLPAGTILTPQENLLYLDYATLASTVTEGRDPETDDEYLSRGVQSMQRLTSVLVTPNQFVAATLEQPYTSRAYSIDSYNPDNDPNNNGPIGQDGGYITVAVYGDNEMLSDDNKEALQAELDGNCQANLFVKLIDPTITPIDVDVEVAVEANVDPASVVSAITSALETALSPNTWGWGTVVRRSYLLSLITNIQGVDYVNSLTTPAADITLTGVANLVTTGTINISAI